MTDTDPTLDRTVPRRSGINLKDLQETMFWPHKRTFFSGGNI